MKSKKLRQFGSDSDISHCHEDVSHDSGSDSDDTFEVPPIVSPTNRYMARSQSDDITRHLAQQGFQQSPELSSLVENNGKLFVYCE